MGLLRRGLGLAAAAVAGAIAAGFVLYVWQARSMPPLRPWHQPLGQHVDFRARDAPEGWGGYLDREDRLFAELDRRVAEWGREDPSGLVSRYDPKGLPWPPGYARRAGLAHDWNRTVALELPHPRGAALLVHGLSDSPYSMRALARLLNGEGFDALALRVPGHGTVPGELTLVSERDMRAAVRLAAHQEAKRAGAGPLWLVGYSNGAALSVDYTLRARQRGDRVPDRLVLLSPALAVSPMASLARFQRRLAVLPLLEKLAWVPILPEFDPYKYNSFPVVAGEKIHALTTQTQERLATLARSGPIEGLPPVLAFVSVVDGTVPASNVAETLLDRMAPNGSELVVFDVNQTAVASELVSADRAWLTALRGRRCPYRVTVVTNARADAPAVVAQTRAAGQDTWVEKPLGLSWPRGVYSLSHVALPFPPDDPLYGTREASRGGLPLGSIDLRGERGVLVVPVAQLMRLRHNPFFSYLAARVRADLPAPGAAGRP